MLVTKTKYDELLRKYQRLEKSQSEFYERQNEAHIVISYLNFANKEFEELRSEPMIQEFCHRKSIYQDKKDENNSSSTVSMVVFLRQLVMAAVKEVEERRFQYIQAEDKIKNLESLKAVDSEYYGRVRDENSELKRNLGNTSAKFADSERELDRFKKNQSAKQDQVLLNTPLKSLIEVCVQRMYDDEHQLEDRQLFETHLLPSLLDAVRAFVDNSKRVGSTWSFDELKALSYLSEERKRIAQYDSILRLYNERIAKLRAQEMDEEDKEEAIQAMKRLRDREIELLASAEVDNG